MSCNTHASVVPAAQAGGCGCGCEMSVSTGRQLLSLEERTERLNAYRQDLLREAAEVERRIADLTKR